LTKVIVIYESKYGNTRLVAESIIEGMKDAPGIDITISNVSEVQPELPAGHDVILIGAPNHMGTAAKSTRKFIDSLGDLNLEAKKGAVFDTYMYKLLLAGN
jgi:menaquinone-dependent protoporphyrinogen IX oxidase